MPNYGITRTWARSGEESNNSTSLSDMVMMVLPEGSSWSDRVMVLPEGSNNWSSTLLPSSSSPTDMDLDLSAAANRIICLKRTFKSNNAYLHFFITVLHFAFEVNIGGA